MVPQHLKLSQIPGSSPAQPETNPTPTNGQHQEPAAPQASPEPDQPLEAPQVTFSNSLVDADDLFAQATSQAKPSADTVVDPDTGGYTVPQPSTAAAPEARPPMDETEALKQAGILMDMRETGQALGLAWAADGNLDAWDHYKYPPWAKKLLIEAWAPVLQDANIRVNKFVRVAYAEGVSTTPLIMMTIKARKARLENDQLKRQLAYYQHQYGPPAAQPAPPMSPGYADNVVEMYPQQPVAAPAAQSFMPPPAPVRPAKKRSKAKTAWEVDENGYFKYDPALKYLKEPDRQEKPQLTAENYALLCQHNGKEVIDNNFEIPQ